MEKSLLETYTNMFIEMNIPDAENIVRDILDKVIEDSKKQGTYNLPSNQGDIFLEQEKTKDNIRKNFEKKRKEGVRDEDIRWWFNLNEIERKMILKVDEMYKMSLYIKMREDGKTEKEADAVVRKHHPMYGDPEDKTHGSDDNRLLPLELKDRINIYIEKQQDNPEEIKKRIEAASSFNALVREEIRKGNI